MIAKRILPVVGGAILIAVIIAQQLRLTDREHELSRYRKGDQQRREFCVAYGGMIGTVQRWLKGAQADALTSRQGADQTPARVFVALTEPAFLKVCGVVEPALGKLTDRDRQCLRERSDGFRTQYDLGCLEALARELAPAISIE